MKWGNAMGVASTTALVAVALSACAPDALRSRQATGFNLYLEQIAGACKPLVIGDRDVGEALVRGGLYDADYNYFFDLTSRLYYGQTTREAYRTAVTGFFGPGASTAKSLDCIVATLPPDRPVPPGGPATKL